MYTFIKIQKTMFTKCAAGEYHSNTKTVSQFLLNFFILH